MKKFKLIKEYPGGPILGTEVEKRDDKIYMANSYLIFRHSVEDYSEFWEEVEDTCYMVSLTDMPFHNAWEPIKIPDIRVDTDIKKHFSSKEGARDFIIQYKPCLCFNDVRGFVGHNFFGSTSHEKLFELVKSRI
jgi:hypothetical protein